MSNATMVERTKAMVMEAKAKNLILLVSEIKFCTAGIPVEITDDYLYFDDTGYDVGETGPLGSVATKNVERLFGGKLILWSAICSLEFFKQPKI